jgi:hypothetical protein
LGRAQEEQYTRINPIAIRHNQTPSAQIKQTNYLKLEISS